MTYSIQIYDVTRKHFVVLKCLLLNTLPLTGYLAADVPFDVIRFSPQFLPAIAFLSDRRLDGCQ